MSSFPQVDPRYCEVLASKQVPGEEWHEHQKWVRNVDEITSTSRRIDLGQICSISDRKS